MHFIKLGTIFIVSWLLVSCIPLVVGGAASVVATTVIFETRDFDTLKQDREIARHIKQAIKDNPELRYSTVAVNSFEGKVLVAGYVGSKQKANQIATIAAETPHVIKVYNELEIGQNPSGYIKQAIGINVKIALNTHAWPRTGMAINVTNVYGSIYLMGKVTPEEGKKAAEIASRVKGVEKVVTLFDYTNENRYNNNAQ